MHKLVTKKSFFVCLAVSLALIIAGAFMFGFLGFNPDSTTKDHAVIEVSDSGYMAFQTDFREELQNYCTDRISAEYDVAGVDYNSSTSAGGVIEYVLRSGTPTQEFLDTLRGEIAASGIEGIDIADVSVSVHNVENEGYTQYIWRTAIAGGVALVILFAYVAIRFRVGMGVSALVAAVHDVLLTLAVVALLRIPAGVALIGVAAFSLLLSAILNLTVLGRMRSDFRNQPEGLSARDAVAQSVAASRKNVLVIAVTMAAVWVVFGVIGAIVGMDLLTIMLCALMSVVVSTYSSLIFMPALYACIKEKSDAKKADKARYNYESDKKRAKEEKAAKKVAEET